MIRALLCAALTSVAVLGCEKGPAPPGLVADAELGVFFGGQVQERDEIPLQLDRSHQTQGIRISFAKPLERDLVVRWELDKPARERGDSRVTRLDEARVRAGQSRFEQVLAFAPGDPLGVWNVRVIVDGELVLDRSVEITAPRRR